MQWQTGPQTPKEWWNYRRAQYKWDKLRWENREERGYSSNNRYDKKHGVRPVFLIILAVVLVVAGYVYRDELKSFLAGSGYLSQNMTTEKTPTQLPAIGQSYVKCLSVQTANYLEYEEQARLQLYDITHNMYTDGTEYGSVQYRYYADIISELQNNISKINEVHILPSSPLHDYETYCTEYYSKVSVFFAGLQNAESITLQDYNSLADWQAEVMQPFDYLVQTFDENGIQYEMVTSDDGEKKIQYQYSSTGIY